MVLVLGTVDNQGKKQPVNTVRFDILGSQKLLKTVLINGSNQSAVDKNKTISDAALSNALLIAQGPKILENAIVMALENKEGRVSINTNSVILVSQNVMWSMMDLKATVAHISHQCEKR